MRFCFSFPWSPLTGSSSLHTHSKAPAPSPSFQITHVNHPVHTFPGLSLCSGNCMETYRLIHSYKAFYLISFVKVGSCSNKFCILLFSFKTCVNLSPQPHPQLINPIYYFYWLRTTPWCECYPIPFNHSSIHTHELPLQSVTTTNN